MIARRWADNSCFQSMPATYRRFAFEMNGIGTIRRLPGILQRIERGELFPFPSYHMRGRTGQILGIAGDNLCYPLPRSANTALLWKWLIEVEDRRFYKHGAIDWRGILRAILRNLGAGRITQGGSTITQQLARTLFLDPSRTWVRKIAEAVIAFKLERCLTKDEILAAYCDYVYMGRGCRGFEAASRVVYRKPFRSLEPDKIPALIGLLGAPERFHPENNENKFWIRAEHKARRLGTGTKRVPLNPLRISRTASKRMDNSVRRELLRLGLPQQDVRAIEITLDEPLQRSIDQVLKEISRDEEVAQVAAVILCNKSGDILAESAWTRGISSGFSPSFSGCLQPGSTFKTFALLTAIESGLATDLCIESAPYYSEETAGGTWRVRNYGDTYYGKLTLEDALIKSDNSVFARLADVLNPDDLAATYDRFSLVERRSFTKAVTIGGIRDGVSLLRVANAYATIARNGVMIEPRLLRFIEYQDSSIAFVKPNRERVVADFGAIQKLKLVLALSGVCISTQVVSGKTGTTNKGSLFAGYNDDVSIALWLDFNHEQPENSPKALTARGVMKRIGEKLLAWSDQRALAII